MVEGDKVCTIRKDLDSLKSLKQDLKLSGAHQNSSLSARSVTSVVTKDVFLSFFTY